MDIWEIEKIVRRGAFTLEEALYQYWPGKPMEGKDYTHDMPEANLTLHVGSAFIRSGFDCFSQHFFDKDSRLDLLALNYTHRMQVRCEAKVMWGGDKAKSSGGDLNRIKAFSLSSKYNGFVEKEDYPNKIGMLLISSWDQRILEWWENPVSPTPDGRQNDESWKQVKIALDESNKQKDDVDPSYIKGVYPMSWSKPGEKGPEKWMRTHGMLYLIFEIK